MLMSENCAFFKAWLCKKREIWDRIEKEYGNRTGNGQNRTVGFKISEGVFLSDAKDCMGTWEWVTEGCKMKLLESRSRKCKPVCGNTVYQCPSILKQMMVRW